MDFHGVAACAEYPNDNPALHEGALWVVTQIGEAPAWERRVAVSVEEGPAIIEEAPVHVVEGLAEVVAGPVDVVEEPVAAKEPPTDPAPPVVEADDEDDDIEIVEDLRFEHTIDESHAPTQAPVIEAQAPTTDAEAPELAGEALPADAFAIFVAAVEDVARGAGANDDAMAMIAVLVGRARIDAAASEEHKKLRAQALGWQGILRGESEDFAACGNGMLDEWAAALVAVVLGNAQRADGLKRELRRRGVAAFGLVEAA